MEQDRFHRGGKRCGLVGPNIIDDQWIYGSNMMDIFNTILKGRRGPNGEEMPMHRGRFTTDEIISVGSIRRRLEPPRRRRQVLLPK